MNSEPEHFEVPHLNYKIHASVQGPTNNLALLLHGGGQSCAARMQRLRNDLAERGVGTVAFDHLGHGLTGGALEQNSLQGRIDETIAVVKQLKEVQINGAIGMSMGGYVVAHLVAKLEFKGIVLLAPAAYNSKALNVPFTEAFTNIIRQHNSWVHSDVWQLLPLFTGRVLLALGADDKVIPPGVIQLYQQSVCNSRDRRFEKLEGVGHMMMNDLRDRNDPRLNPLIDQIAETVSA